MCVPLQADVTLAAMLPIAMLALMGVDPVQILVPALSTIVALSFVFAPSLQQFVTCLVFVLVQHPFDVGDVVRSVWRLRSLTAEVVSAPAATCFALVSSCAASSCCRALRTHRYALVRLCAARAGGGRRGAVRGGHRQGHDDHVHQPA